MNERLSIEVYDLKVKKCEQQNFKCGVCGKPITPYSCQLAHRIPKSKSNLAKFGKEIIHNELNMTAVCSLKCNSAVLCDPSTRPVAAAALVAEIRKNIER